MEEDVDTTTGDEITGKVGTVRCAPEAENDGNVYMTDVGGKIPMPERMCACMCMRVCVRVRIGEWVGTCTGNQQYYCHPACKQCRCWIADPICVVSLLLAGGGGI